MPNSVTESQKQTASKTFVLWLDYLPPSGNKMLSSNRRRVMQMKTEARAAWSSALFASGLGPVMTTIFSLDANGYEMPSPTASGSMMGTNDLNGNMGSSKPTDQKGSQ